MKLIEKPTSAWRFFSVQAMSLAIAIEGTWLAMPPDLKARVPETIVDVIGMAVLMLGIFGRVVDQGGEK